MELGRPYYSYIKNTIAAVAEELGVAAKAKKTAAEASLRGGIPRPASASEISTLLSKSEELSQQMSSGEDTRKGGDR